GIPDGPWLAIGRPDVARPIAGYVIQEKRVNAAVSPFRGVSDDFIRAGGKEDGLWQLKIRRCTVSHALLGFARFRVAGHLCRSICNGGQQQEENSPKYSRIEHMNFRREKTPHPGPLPFGWGEGESLTANMRRHVHRGGSTSF